MWAERPSSLRYSQRTSLSLDEGKIPRRHGPILWNTLPGFPVSKHQQTQGRPNTSVSLPPSPFPSTAGAAALPRLSFPEQHLHRRLHWRHPLCHLPFAPQPAPVWLLSLPLPPSTLSRQGPPDLPMAKCRSHGHLPVLRPYSTTPALLLERTSSLGFYGLTWWPPTCV